MAETERARRPFWIHQLVEYLVGLALISASVQLPEPTVPAVMGLVVLFNAAIAQGAAGAFRLVSKPLGFPLLKYRAPADVGDHAWSATPLLSFAEAGQPFFHLLFLIFRSCTFLFACLLLCILGFFPLNSGSPFLLSPLHVSQISSVLLPHLAVVLFHSPFPLSTSSFYVLSIHAIFSSLLQHHISEASNFFSILLLIVQVQHRPHISFNRSPSFSY